MTDEADRDGWGVVTVRSDGVVEATSSSVGTTAITPGEHVPSEIAALLPTHDDLERSAGSHEISIGREQWRCLVHAVPLGPTVVLMRQVGDEAAEATPLIDRGLTPRQTEVAIALMHTGGTNSQLARSLDKSEGAVQKHLETVFRVLGVDSGAAAVVERRSLVA